MRIGQMPLTIAAGLGLLTILARTALADGGVTLGQHVAAQGTDSKRNRHQGDPVILAPE
jgi:hypothetical protein